MSESKGDSKTPMACKYHFSSGCKNKDKCTYSHKLSDLIKSKLKAGLATHNSTPGPNQGFPFLYIEVSESSFAEFRSLAQVGAELPEPAKLKWFDDSNHIRCKDYDEYRKALLELEGQELDNHIIQISRKQKHKFDSDWECRGQYYPEFWGEAFGECQAVGCDEWGCDHGYSTERQETVNYIQLVAPTRSLTNHKMEHNVLVSRLEKAVKRQKHQLTKGLWSPALDKEIQGLEAQLGKKP